MTKKNWRKSFKSFIVNHIDVENNQELQENKAEVESKVEKILELLKENNEGTELVESFLSQYESLYSRYDNLTGELRQKVNSKNKNKNLDSSSSSSDSDDSSSEKEVHNGNAKKKLILKENEALKLEISNLMEKIEEMNKEKNGILFEKEAALNRIEEGNKVVEDLKIFTSKLENEREALKMDFEGLKGLKEENDNLKEENDNLLKKIEGLEIEVCEISVLFKKIEDIEIESAEQISELNELNSELEKKSGEIINYVNEIEHLKEELMSKNTEIEDLTKQKFELEEKINGLELRFSESENEFTNNLNIAEKKVKEMSKKMDIKNEKINTLEDKSEDLKRDIEIKGEEVHTLVEYVRTLEVKLRLSTQKSRVTEQLLSEKDEDYLSKEEKLQHERKSLLEKIATLSEIISGYKETQNKIVSDVSLKVNETLNGIESFNMKYEEDYGHLETRIYEILNELNIATTWAKEVNKQKDVLENEVTKLALELKTKKEDELRLINKIESLKTLLVNEEDVTKSLRKEKEEIQKEMEEKIEKIEIKMKEKDLGLFDLSEEKREVIRQLCVWIEYHRERYDNLRDMVLKSTSGRRQITA